MIAIRGAITCENTKNSISHSATLLVSKIFLENAISLQQVVSIVFSVTKDLDAQNPATAFRQDFDAADVPLFCVQEADFCDSLPFCIRVIIYVNAEIDKSSVRHSYLRGAKKLREDLQKDLQK